MKLIRADRKYMLSGARGKGTVSHSNKLGQHLHGVSFYTKKCKSYLKSLESMQQPDQLSSVCLSALCPFGGCLFCPCVSPCFSIFLPLLHSKAAMSARLRQFFSLALCFNTKILSKCIPLVKQREAVFWLFQFRATEKLIKTACF